MFPAILVFVGSGIGGVLRYASGVAAIRYLGPSFPYGTLSINILGSALLGAVTGFLTVQGGGLADVRLFLTTGIIGGFTTWSTFTLDAVTLWERDQPLEAIAYVAGSLITSLVAIAGMLVLVRRLA